MNAAASSAAVLASNAHSKRPGSPTQYGSIHTVSANGSQVIRRLYNSLSAWTGDVVRSLGATFRLPNRCVQIRAVRIKNRLFEKCSCWGESCLDSRDRTAQRRIVLPKLMQRRTHNLSQLPRAPIPLTYPPYIFKPSHTALSSQANIQRQLPLLSHLHLA
jgi:hypothetical protein